MKGLCYSQLSTALALLIHFSYFFFLFYHFHKLKNNFFLVVDALRKTPWDVKSVQQPKLSC